MCLASVGAVPDSIPSEASNFGVDLAWRGRTLIERIAEVVAKVTHGYEEALR